MVVVMALFAGFAGGVAATLVIRAREQPHPERVVRAHGFELVDDAGQAISYWGIDKQQNIVLAFGIRRDNALPERRVAVDIKDPDNQTYAIGLAGDDTPFLTMRGRDRKPRVNLLFSLYEKPVLVMADETGPRLRLGFEGSDTLTPDDNDWWLDFRPEVARIGFHAEKKDGKTYVQGGVYVRKDKVTYP